MSSFQQKITSHDKSQEMAQNEDTEQVSELDSDMTQSLELSDREFKIIMLLY